LFVTVLVSRRRIGHRLGIAAGSLAAFAIVRSCAQ
jgi:hypothetical protein